jgi:hypothetical protein
VNSPSIQVDVTPIPDRIAAPSDPVRIRAGVTNVGTDTIDTQLYRSALLIDEQPSFGWGLAIGNGAREPLEVELPPGQHVDVDRILTDLVREPGEYTLVLEVQGVRSAPSTLYVTST